MHLTDAVFPIRIWIEDTDFGGVVYHANYLKYFERARTAWAESLGFGTQAQLATGILFAVRTASLDYRLPARLDDSLEVITRITRVGRASVDFSQCLRHVSSDKLVLCVAATRVASVTLNIKSCPIPEQWRVQLTACRQEEGTDEF